jgi:hypothetical protein
MPRPLWSAEKFILQSPATVVSVSFWTGPAKIQSAHAFWFTWFSNLRSFTLGGMWTATGIRVGQVWPMQIPWWLCTRVLLFLIFSFLQWCPLIADRLTLFWVKRVFFWWEGALSCVWWWCFRDLWRWHKFGVWVWWRLGWDLPKRTWGIAVCRGSRNSCKRESWITWIRIVWLIGWVGPWLWGFMRFSWVLG